MADLQEHKAIAAKYAPKLNSAALDGMARTYALVLSNKDSQYVACGDDAERVTVRTNFLKKKLALTNSDADLDAAIDAVCATMKEDRFKSRLAMYYMLADKYGKLAMFVK
jgi:Protein of unknown function (DUF2853)